MGIVEERGGNRIRIRDSISSKRRVVGEEEGEHGRRAHSSPCDSFVQPVMPTRYVNDWKFVWQSVDALATSILLL